MKIFFAILGILLLITIGYLAIQASSDTAQSEDREEALSPTTDDAPASDTFLTATDEKSGITFTYPRDFTHTYVRATSWPPRFVNSTDPIKCELDEQTQAMSGATSSTQTLSGTTYCIWVTSEGAAGSVYHAYQITYPHDGQYLTMSFTLQYPQCANYPSEQTADCEAQQSTFPINDMTDAIAQSARLPD